MWLQVLFTAIVSALLVSVLEAQQQPWMPDGQHAVTFCRHGKAESWIMASAAASSHRDALLAHEEVHRQQAAAYPTCEAFYATINSRERLLDVELPAYCAQLRVELGQGADSAATAGAMALRLAVEVQQKSRAPEIQAWLLNECKRQSHGSLSSTNPDAHR